MLKAAVRVQGRAMGLMVLQGRVCLAESDHPVN